MRQSAWGSRQGVGGALWVVGLCRSTLLGLDSRRRGTGWPTGFRSRAYAK